MLTEQPNERSARLDKDSTLDILHIINDEDQKVARVVHDAIPQIAQAVDAVVAAFAQEGRLIYIGAGTSGRLGILDAVECVPTFSIPPEQVIGVLAGGYEAITHSIEGAEDNRAGGARDLQAIGLQPRDVVVGIAASGHTPYVLGAIDYAAQLGCVTVGISCNTPAPLLDAAQIKIALPVGPEVVTGSTRMKAGTAQKLTLNMISTAAMARSGKVYRNLMVDVRVVNEKLVRRAVGIVQRLTGLNEAEAHALLERSGSHVKTAIVMHRLNVDVETARERLRAANGFLGKVIDS
ncbi:MAG: N-acetylmuramic acid 6-phosphate etherase [Anaerolineae bacterium]